MNTSELIGAELDYAVGKAAGMLVRLEFHQTNPPRPLACWVITDRMPDFERPYAPSTNWEQGGPIIERERITISYDDEGGRERGMWNAYVHECDVMCQDFDSPLIAAMRAYVASKFGSEVKIANNLPDTIQK